MSRELLPIHVVRTLLDFTTALKLGNLLHHRTRHTSFCQDNPPALWLMVPPVSLLADLVAVQPVPARASLWAFGWPAARLPERNSETAAVAWYTLKGHVTVAREKGESLSRLFTS